MRCSRPTTGYAVWLHGACGRGAADAGSDLDLSVAVRDADFDAFAGQWREWLAGITPTVVARPIGPGSGHAPAAVAYSDVKAAWEDYLAHDNNGRGFILIGHSQGSGHLIQLIKDDIDNNPAVRPRQHSERRVPASSIGRPAQRRDQTKIRLIRRRLQDSKR